VRNRLVVDEEAVARAFETKGTHAAEAFTRGGRGVIGHLRWRSWVDEQGDDEGSGAKAARCDGADVAGSGGG